MEHRAGTREDGGLVLLKDLYRGKLELDKVQEELAIAAAAYTDSNILIPIGTIMSWVTWRFRVGLTTAVNVDVGIAGATTRYCTNIAEVDAGDSYITPAVLDLYTAATALRITPDATPGDANGRMILTAYFLKATAPQQSTKLG